MKKILNKRLETLSAFIQEKEIVLDIGCDHGLLGIYLTLNRDNVKVISSDIKKEPLKKAWENIHQYGLDNEIEVRLGDGLEVMSKDIQTVVISGMGALNIVKILEKIEEYPNVSKLVLSPNNDFPLLRDELFRLGFTITREEMVFEKGKYYLISEYHHGKKKVNAFFGKLDLRKAAVQKYYQYLYDKNLKILNNLSPLAQEKHNELMTENEQIEKKLKNLNK